jgi:capsule polysaccharide export protein KpsE/RkpR
MGIRLKIKMSFFKKLWEELKRIVIIFVIVVVSLFVLKFTVQAVYCMKASKAEGALSAQLAMRKAGTTFGSAASDAIRVVP